MKIEDIGRDTSVGGLFIGALMIVAGVVSILV